MINPQPHRGFENNSRVYQVNANIFFLQLPAHPFKGWNTVFAHAMREVDAGAYSKALSGGRYNCTMREEKSTARTNAETSMYVPIGICRRLRVPATSLCSARRLCFSLKNSALKILLVTLGSRYLLILTLIISSILAHIDTFQLTRSIRLKTFMEIGLITSTQLHA